MNEAVDRHISTGLGLARQAWAQLLTLVPAPANLTRIRKTAAVGIKSIYSHGLRSLLTVLGIVIGVAAVISMLSVSEGASFEAQQQFRALGSNNIIVKSVKPAALEAARGGGMRPQAITYGITYEDVITIQDTIPGISNVIPSRIIKRDVRHLGRDVSTDVVGTTIDYPVSRNYQLRFGRFFSQEEMDEQRNVVVLSDEVATALFPMSNPLGESIRIDSNYYNVIGVMEPEAYSNLGRSQAGSSNAAPTRIFIPISCRALPFWRDTGETVFRRCGNGNSAIARSHHPG
jgi:putative ABC transport system permease protein